MAKSVKNPTTTTSSKPKSKNITPPTLTTTKSSEKIVDSDSDNDDSDLEPGPESEDSTQGDRRPFVDSEAEETDDEDDGVGSESGSERRLLRSDSEGVEEEDVDMDAPGVDLRASRRSQKDRSEGSKRKERKDAVYPPYQPPPSLLPLPSPSISFASSPFEWDNLRKREGVEVWCVRVPGSFKPSRLSTLQLDPSQLKSPSTKPKSKPLGTLTTTKRTYTLRPAASPHPTASTSTSHTHTHGNGLTQSNDPTLEAEHANLVGEREVTEVGLKADTESGTGGGGGGGEEMFGLRLMVPRVGGEGGGRLFIAPKPITRHLILTPDISPLASSTTSDPTLSTSLLPGFDDLVPSIAHEDDSLTGGGANTPSVAGRRQKHKQPEGKLRLRNVPFGGLVSMKREGAMTVEEARKGSSSTKEVGGGKRKSGDGNGAKGKGADGGVGSGAPPKKKSRKSEV